MPLLLLAAADATTSWPGAVTCCVLFICIAAVLITLIRREY